MDDYVSPDPVRAAQDALDDARRTRRATRWSYGWRIGYHLLILGLQLGAWHLYDTAQWFYTAEDLDTVPGNGGSGLFLFLFFTTIFLHCFGGVLVWATTHLLSLPAQTRAVRLAERKCRDVRATHDQEVHAKAEEQAVAKLREELVRTRENLVRTWQPPQGREQR